MPYRNAAKSKSGSRSKSRGKRRSGSTRSRSKRKRASSSASSRRRSASTKRKPAAKRKYTRYDPETFVSARVTNDDPRYDEWLTATQMRSAKKAQRREREKAIDVGLKVAQAAVPSVAPVAARAVTAARAAAETARRSVARVAATRVAVGAGSAATVGLGATAGLAILAGVASYYGTTWIMGRIRQLTDPQEKAYQLATAYRKARAEAQAKLGRPLTAEEVKYLGAELNAQLVRMGIRS